LFWSLAASCMLFLSPYGQSNLSPVTWSFIYIVPCSCIYIYSLGSS
jgi:hypothetical protein